jgi:signal transduction histidine kinase
MRLADFIVDHLDAILVCWDAFARKNEPAASAMDDRALRNHASQMLRAIAADMGTAQSREQGIDKSESRGDTDEHSAASTHGAARLISGFTIDQLLAEYRALRASVLRLWFDQGQANLATDIDDMMRFNEAIDQAQAESVARYSTMVNHSQHLFLAILGHDLRNPLNTTVMASSFLMRAPGMPPTHAEVVARIHRSGVRMGRLIDDLIDYTRSHLGAALPMTLHMADMGTICRAIVEEMRLAHPQRVIQFEPGADLEGIWDEGRIAQVFSNLLGNALQHGEVSHPIRMKLESSGSDILVSIHNMGKAIAPEALALIFDPLVRLGDAGTRKGTTDNSLGIGLYIARVIVEAHGGEIRVTSDERSGTTFSVRLPRVPPPARKARL